MYRNYLKPLFDFLFSLVMLILLSPVFFIVILLINFFDYGPAIFKQERVGKDEVIFLIYKFRTMVINADKVGPVLTEKYDPRVTPIGKLLRYTSLDELPQLINILKGEMSLLGPRPEVPSIVKDYTDKQRGVFKAKPGLSGLAQIHGRDELSIETKLNYDLEYIEKLSLWLDLKIFLLTFPTLISGRGIN